VRACGAESIMNSRRLIDDPLARIAFSLTRNSITWEPGLGSHPVPLTTSAVGPILPTYPVHQCRQSFEVLPTHRSNGQHGRFLPEAVIVASIAAGFLL
jgi:hypothetical protein